MNIKFRCDIFRCSLMDDTGVHEYPVIFMNVRNIKFDLHKYEDVDDAAVFILKVSNYTTDIFIENGNHKKEKWRREAIYGPSGLFECRNLLFQHECTVVRAFPWTLDIAANLGIRGKIYRWLDLYNFSGDAQYQCYLCSDGVSNEDSKEVEWVFERLVKRRNEIVDCSQERDKDSGKLWDIDQLRENVYLTEIKWSQSPRH